MPSFVLGKWIGTIASVYSSGIIALDSALRVAIQYGECSESGAKESVTLKNNLKTTLRNSMWSAPRTSILGESDAPLRTLDNLLTWIIGLINWHPSLPTMVTCTGYASNMQLPWSLPWMGRQKFPQCPLQPLQYLILGIDWGRSWDPQSGPEHRKWFQERE